MISSNFRQLGGPNLGAAMQQPRLKPKFMREQMLDGMEDVARAVQLQRQIDGGAGGQGDEPQQPQGPITPMGINGRYGDSAQRGGASKIGFGATAGSPFYQPRRANSIMGYAKGGNVKAGQTILVGEEGPEIMRVKKDAEIIPNHRVSKFYQSRAKKKRKC